MELDALLDRISVCERKTPGIHKEMLRNYQRAFYFDLITESQFKTIEEDIAALGRIYEF
ncbi:hypothetical protein KKA03_01995 [archaeon]|nr:hypothetical protein [archaeon]